MKRHLPFALLIAILLPALCSPCVIAAERPAGTPVELVRAYDSLADSILAIKKTEQHMVHSILATTYNHARATVDSIDEMVTAGEDASSQVEKLADLVAQLGNEGDAAVAAIRKRLVEGGHHHNAQGEEKGVYDEGFVIVTRAARKAFLAAAGNIAKMGGSPDPAKLDAEWRGVSNQYRSLVEGD